MSDAKKPTTEKSFEERKKALIAQGAAQRQKIDASIGVIRENLHADKLAKSAMSHITAKAYGAVDKLFGRHHADRVDLSTDLGPDGSPYDTNSGLANSFAKMQDFATGDHAAGRLISTARRFLPLATTAFAILRRRRMIVPVLRGAAVLGGIGAGAYFYHRHKQRAEDLATDPYAGIDSDALPYAYYPEPASTGALDAQGQLH